MIAYRYYVVAKGKKPGIYHSWAECQREVNGFRNPLFKGFNELKGAQEWLAHPTLAKTQQKSSAKQKRVKDNGTNFAVYLWTDGGSRNHGNQKGQHVKPDDKAAWAYLIISGTQRFSAAGGEYGATNNRMEVMALLQALKKVKQLGKNNAKICATLDSRYVLDAIQKGWLSAWQRRGWKTASGTQVANQALWEELAQVLPDFSQLYFEWTKGHRDNQGNVFVDELLNKEMDQL